MIVIRISALLLLFCLLLSCRKGRSQPLQTVYYDNGQKALEGHWSYTCESNYSLQPLLQTLQEFAGRGGRQLHTEEGRERTFRDNLNLFIRPDGLIRGWYQSGKPMFEMVYTDGVAKGRLRSYHEADGTVAVEGAFENGMPTGVWTTYDFAGKLAMRGTYVPYTQAELAERWKEAYMTIALSHDRAAYNRRKQNENRAVKEPLPPFEDSLKLLSYHILNAFKDADLFTETDAKREGDFMLIKSRPLDTLYLHYTADVPTGMWHHTCCGDAQMLYGIAYSVTGHPVALLKSATRQISVAEILQDNRALELTRRREDSLRRSTNHNNYGEPNGIDPGLVDAPLPPVKNSMDSNSVFRVVEQMPEFTGDINLWLEKNLIYPQQDVEGRVAIQFVVRNDGSITNPEIMRSSGNNAMDEEALRLVRVMPKWKPGKQNGKAVNVYFTLPITFRQK